MSRLLALQLVLALMAAAGGASSLHRHIYDGHEHPQHDHGFAAHRHAAVGLPAPSDRDGVGIESAVPGRTESFTFVRAALTQILIVGVESGPTVRMEHQRETQTVTSRTDVRVHGPPPRPPASPRAPPSSTALA